MANLLSSLRLALVLPFFWLVLARSPWAAVLFSFAIASDLADGPLARRRGTVSALGRSLDHAADFCFVSAGLFAAAWRDALPMVLPLAVIVAFAQYALDSHLAHGERGLRMSALGRWNGVLYFVPLGGVCLSDLGVTGLGPPTRAFAWLLVASTAGSIADRALAALASRRARAERAAGTRAR